MNTPSASHDEYESLLAAYALGDADPETAQRVEQLLTTQPEYRAVLESYRAVAQILALAAPSAAPAPDLRGRLLDRLAAEAQGKPLPPQPRARPKMPLWQRFALALNLLLILGLAGWNISLQQQQQADAARFQRTWNTMVNAMSAPGVQQYLLTSNTAGASGAFLFAPEQRLGCLVVRGLPQLGQNQVYQVWLEQGAQPRSAGTFRVNAEGNGWLVVNNATPIDDFSVVRVTVEPAGGSATPTNQTVIGGNISF